MQIAFEPARGLCQFIVLERADGGAEGENLRRVAYCVGEAAQLFERARAQAELGEMARGEERNAGEIGLLCERGERQGKELPAVGAASERQERFGLGARAWSGGLGHALRFNPVGSGEETVSSSIPQRMPRAQRSFQARRSWPLNVRACVCVGSSVPP